MSTHTQMNVPAHETWAAGVDTLTIDTAGVAPLTADTHFSFSQFQTHFLVDFCTNTITLTRAHQMVPNNLWYLTICNTATLYK